MTDGEAAENTAAGEEFPLRYREVWTMLAGVVAAGFVVLYLNASQSILDLVIAAVFAVIAVLWYIRPIVAVTLTEAKLGIFGTRRFQIEGFADLELDGRMLRQVSTGRRIVATWPLRPTDVTALRNRIDAARFDAR